MTEEEVSVLCRFAGLHRNEPHGGRWWDDEGNEVFDFHTSGRSFFRDLNACFKYFTPPLRERSIFASVEDLGDCYLATLKDWGHLIPICADGVWMKEARIILADDQENPAAAFCEAVWKLIKEGDGQSPE